MGHVAAVIVDPEKARAARIQEKVRVKLVMYEEATSTLPAAVRARRDMNAVARHVEDAVTAEEPLPAVGELWGVAERECPLLLPNCENCGDPDFRDACAAAGHCPYCGTAHGVSSARRLREVGVELVEVDGPPTRERRWDSAARRMTSVQQKEQ